MNRKEALSPLITKLDEYRKLSYELSESAKIQDGNVTYPESHPLFD